MSKKYKKKPIVIEAVQWTGNLTEIQGFCPMAKMIGVTNTALCIPTLEGDHTAEEGSYIIKGVKGEFYPCAEAIFHMTYDEVQLDSDPLSDTDGGSWEPPFEYQQKLMEELEQVKENSEIAWLKSVGECEAFIMASMFQQHVQLTKVQGILLEHLNDSLLGNLNAHLLEDIRTNYDYVSSLVEAHEKKMDSFKDACQTRREVT